MSENPPPLVAVIARTPPNEAPIAMLIAASSSSACFTTTPISWEWAAIQCMIVDAGVIGYWARNLQPAAAAPKAIAWFPVRRSLGRPEGARAFGLRAACSWAYRYPSVEAARFQSTTSPFFFPNESARAR